MGKLWEHYVLNELTARLQTVALRYWRDKQGHEIDLVWAPRGRPPAAIECKWSARKFDPANLRIFARRYPEAVLLVVTADTRPAFTRHYDGVEVEFVDLQELVSRIGGKRAASAR